MKNIKKFENGTPWFADETREAEIGDVVICTAGEGILEYGRTYIIEDIKPGYSDGNRVRSEGPLNTTHWKSFKLENLDKWWDWDRFKIRNLMNPVDVKFYDQLMVVKDTKKFNI